MVSRMGLIVRSMFLALFTRDHNVCECAWAKEKRVRLLLRLIARIDKLLHIYSFQMKPLKLPEFCPCFHENFSPNKLVLTARPNLGSFYVKYVFGVALQFEASSISNNSLRKGLKVIKNIICNTNNLLCISDISKK